LVQPEFNIAAILSKISVADVVSNQLSAAQRESSPFEAYFEAAFQQIDDPQLAATLATLNESGMIVPDSIAAFNTAGAGSTLPMAAAADGVPQPFRMLQLLNGRSVITTSMAFNDNSMRSASLNEPLLVESEVPFSDSQAAYLTQSTVPSEAVGASESMARRLSTESWLTSAARGGAPVALSAVQGQTVTPGTTATQAQTATALSEAIQSSANSKPSVSSEPQAIFKSQAASGSPVVSQPDLAAGAKTAAADGLGVTERRQSTEAWLTRTTRGGAPVALSAVQPQSVQGQTVTPGTIATQAQAATVLPEAIQPSVNSKPSVSSEPQAIFKSQAASGSPVVSQPDLAAGAKTAAADGLGVTERRQSTEAWLTSPARTGAPVKNESASATSARVIAFNTAPTVTVSPLGRLKLL